MQVRAYLVQQYHAKVAARYQWTEGDVEWNERNTLVYPAICSLAGLVRMHAAGGLETLPLAAGLHALCHAGCCACHGLKRQLISCWPTCPVACRVCLPARADMRGCVGEL
jgi:hypothetical protein